MPTIKTPKAILDTKTLLETLEAHKTRKNTSLIKLRPFILRVTREALEHGKKEIHTRFMSTNKGAANVRETSYLIDGIIQTLFTYTAQYTENSDSIAIAAMGGYGREELSPHSDIDLIFLYRSKTKAAARTISEMYALHILGSGVTGRTHAMHPARGFNASR